MCKWCRMGTGRQLRPHEERTGAYETTQLGLPCQTLPRGKVLTQLGASHCGSSPMFWLCFPSRMLGCHWVPEPTAEAGILVPWLTPCAASVRGLSCQYLHSLLCEGKRIIVPSSHSKYSRGARFLKNPFYWSTVYLKCCVSFCYKAKWFNYIYNIYIYIHILMAYYWILNIVSCAIQYVLVDHLFYMW